MQTNSNIPLVSLVSKANSMHHQTHVLYLLFNLKNEVDGRRKLRSAIWNYFHDFNVDVPID